MTEQEMLEGVQELCVFLKNENSKSTRLHQIKDKWYYPVLDDEKVTLEVKELPERFVPFVEEARKL